MLSRSLYHDWSFANEMSVIMYQVKSNGSLGDRILQTAVSNPNHCQLQKLCVTKEANTAGGFLGADILVQTAWLLNKLAAHSPHCTKPKNAKG